MCLLLSDKQFYYQKERKKMKVDVTKCQEEKILDNLILLHTRLCEKSDNAYAIMDFTQYVRKLLKKRGEKLKYFIPEGKGYWGSNPPKKLKNFSSD